MLSIKLLTYVGGPTPAGYQPERIDIQQCDAQVHSTNHVQDTRLPGCVRDNSESGNTYPAGRLTGTRVPPVSVPD